MLTGEQTAPDEALRPSRRQVFVWYVIARYERRRLCVLTVRPPFGGDVLPLFTTKAAAWAFFERQGLHPGWSVRESTAGELMSLLMGPCVEAERVAFDPDGDVVALAASEVRCMGRREFLDASMRGEGVEFADAEPLAPAG